MKTLAFLGASALAAGSIALSGTFAPAQAFVFSGGSVTGITADDIGSSFTINFDGNVDTNDVTGLTSKALFTLASFDGLSALFDIQLTNTSSGAITGSRVSALGFDIAPDLSGATALGDFAVTVLDSAFPNQFGDIDLCVKNGQANNCQGGVGTGNNGGPLIGKSFNFDLTLAWSDKITSFDLSNFGVRYQSIDSSALGLSDASGTGRGTPTTSVPEPATAAALGTFALLGLAMKKKAQISA